MITSEMLGDKRYFVLYHPDFGVLLRTPVLGRCARSAEWHKAISEMEMAYRQLCDYGLRLPRHQRREFFGALWELRGLIIRAKRAHERALRREELESSAKAEALRIAAEKAAGWQGVRIEF